MNKISYNKGSNMLPFIAGAALGALAVVAYNKKDKLIDLSKEFAKDGLEKSKKLAKDSIAKGKKVASKISKTNEKPKTTRKTRAKKPAVSE
ncbi:hypothetical protein [Campylobacter mucosalis]|uniref:Uncharacterized protein n=1 Tax=Campylobacter mucosalis CCUG 21559 TaxID=1032067 RepID=A0A6G5QHB6_9BACT|nr:hypothetical protein [Campylobacter mucosalis]QCD44999.1 hypothetical protein CMUC_1233 [Campylobacter mucosalis CCUG 21559]